MKLKTSCHGGKQKDGWKTVCSETEFLAKQLNSMPFILPPVVKIEDLDVAATHVCHKIYTPTDHKGVGRERGEGGLVTSNGRQTKDRLAVLGLSNVKKSSCHSMPSASHLSWLFNSFVEWLRAINPLRVVGWGSGLQICHF